MDKVAIITDSTGYIPKDLVDKYHLTVIPQVLIWEEKTYLDGVDIQPREFYNRLKNARVMPTTSQATIGSFRKNFSHLLDEGCQILAILVSDKLSGTIDSAIQARDMLPEAPIEIINSNTIAMALGFYALAVARAAKEGASLSECKDLAEKAVDHTGVIFAVDTLEFLHRGGRIGGASRFLGTALKL
ncbi:MAG TPA: DegV family protein [bacterium]|nr:DegV family protein [bacterium]